jgi:regulator of sigma E protease
MLTTAVATVVVLGLLILFHELGHFLVAKRCGVGVLKFSIGFGPTIIGRKIGDTEYVLSAIPLGGFVKMVGEDPEEEVSAADRAIAFQTQPLWRRLAIVLAGPAANILFAFIAFTIVLAAYGDFVPVETAKVGGVRDKMPAAEAGLKAGDMITAVDGKPIEKWKELSEAIRGSGGRGLVMKVQRDGSNFDLNITPKQEPEKNIFNETVGTAYLIGIEPSFEAKPVGLLTAIELGAKQTVWWVGTLATSVLKLLQGSIPAKDIGGPLLIAQAAGQQARLGLDYLLRFMAVISVNLGVLNLLPIPILDGGHLLFFLIEAVRRRPLETRPRELAQQVGLVLLLSLMAFAFYNDIARLLQSLG